MPARRTTPRPRAETMLETRAALLAAAVEEFGVSGLDASLDGICTRANLTRGAFYVHFADRDALILAVMEHVLGGFVALLTGLSPAVGGTARALDLFTAAANARSPAVHGGRALRFHHLMEACQRSKPLGARYRAIVAQARDRIAEGITMDQTAGQTRNDTDATALADLLAVLALGVVATLELGVPIDLTRIGDTMKRCIAPGRLAQ
jgi:TetR/AcrR family transcriptional regulator, transcriptional repressor for nem operon